MESFVSDSGGSLSVIYHPMSIGKLFSSKLDKNLFWHTENLALMLLKSGLKLFLRRIFLKNFLIIGFSIFRAIFTY